jgi:mitochondrial fission protein ELM1
MRAILLSDGKPGHYNQSLGVIERLPECEYHWIDVRFRSKQRDNLLRVLMRLLAGFRLPRRLIKACLHMALQRDTLDEIYAVEPDFILSTGSSVAAPNLLIGQLFNAKTVTCRRPSPVGVHHFDLAILPQMYWPRRNRSNICKTLGVPNRVRPEKLEMQRKELQTDLDLSNQRRVGALIGGEDRHDTITETTAARLIEVLQQFATRRDMQLLLTTSRRTPLSVENLISKRLSNAQHCPILVLAHGENSLTDPVGTIFALSDVIIVTEDSFSMVCEAASSGKRVIILEVDHKIHRRPKRHQVYSEIMRYASVMWSSVEDLEIALETALADESPIKPLRDTQVAATAVRQILKD